MAGESYTVGFENFAMDGIVNWLADKNPRREGWPKKRVPVRHRTIARRDVIHHTDIIEPLDRLANGKNACAVAVVRKIVFKGWSGQIGVPTEVTLVGII